MILVLKAMIHQYNSKVLEVKRRSLRKRQTYAERILWNELRNRKICNIKFYRQYSVGLYILDFYSSSVRLAIEVDGEVHNTEDAIAYDNKRTKYLNSENITVIRFKNEEVYDELESVVNIIKQKTLEAQNCKPILK